MGAYDPEVPAKRPGGKPINAPKYRILVHRKYEAAWNQLSNGLACSKPNNSGIMSHIRQAAKTL